MIRIVIPSGDYFNEATQEIVHIEGRTVLLEHSLRSLAKWESRWKKPFLSKQEKNKEETIDYVRCMAVTPDVNPAIFETLNANSLNKISQYINDSMTATTFSDHGNKKPSMQIITAELIYYWMVALQIPFECQDWHLNRLLTLIRVCEIKNQPKKKQSKKEILAHNAKLNAERRKRLGTSG